MSHIIHSRDYDIFIGNDTFFQLGKFLSKHNYSNARKIILVDENTKEYCLPLIQRSVPALQDATVLEIKAGEASKSIEVVTDLWKQLTALNADRSTLFINLGGGMIGDVGGFVASTYVRGIRFVNIPTTMLAMVDASVGGKNGINFEGLKNQVGTFTNSESVFISPVFLKTLPPEEIRCGFAEVIKHALISDETKWQKVKAIDDFGSVNWTDVILESVWTKNKIVNSDYRDRHKRQALNFGHTIGHALESYSMSQETPLKHGEAVAVGIIGETWLSQQLCGFAEEHAKEVYALVNKFYHSHQIEFNADALIDLMKNDKKNQSQKINFTLLNSIGEPVINQTPDELQIRQAIDFSREQLASFTSHG